METSIDRAMRVAWFRPASDDRETRLDGTTPLLDELRGAGHVVDVVTEAHAHDFVWRHARHRYDVPVFELDDDLAHAYVWPYLIHYGGIALFRRLTLHDSRVTRLTQEQRTADYEAEFTFNEGRLPSRGARYWLNVRWRMLRVPMTAASLSAVPYARLVNTLQHEYPDARVRYAPLAVPPAPRVGAAAVDGAHSNATVVFGLQPRDDRPSVRRAFARALDTGSRAELIVDDLDALIARADVILSLEWPRNGRPMFDALAAMAAARPVVALETGGSADWPALDPQTWQLRAFEGGDPVAVTIDTRQEEHRLLLTFRRLAADAALRHRLGHAGFAWWQTHAAPPAAAAAWQRLLIEARDAAPRARPAGWPAHLDADGTGRARALLNEIGVTVDVIDCAR